MEAGLRGELAADEHLNRVVCVRAAGKSGVMLVIELPVRERVEFLARQKVEVLRCSSHTLVNHLHYHNGGLLGRSFHKIAYLRFDESRLC